MACSSLTPDSPARADKAFHALGHPAADLMFATGDADAVAERYERTSDQPPAPDSLIDPADNPLVRRDAPVP